MYSKAVLFFAAAGLVGQAAAAVGRHQHGLQHAHHKRSLFTEVVTVTDWVTVTVTYGETSTTGHKVFYTDNHHPHLSLNTTTSHSTTSSTSAAPVLSSTTSTTSTAIVPKVSSTSTTSPNPTTSPSSAPGNVDVVVNTPAPTPAVASTTAHAAPATPSVAGSGSTGITGGSGTSGSGSTGATGRRGLAYNDASLLPQFLNAGTKISWAYNWGQTDDSKTSLEFAPMLWGLKDGFPDTWPANAQKAIDAGSKCLLSFNEPDYPSQANMSPQLAAQKHIELMNPFAGKARIGSPAITNSNQAGQGIQWMQQWFDACAGQCAVDFVNIHIYGVDTNAFLAHLLQVYNTFKKPVWITEFAFSGSPDEINSQLETVIDQIETNSTFSFVERYSYFMVADGSLVQGNSLSTYGNTFAYGA
ncbi:9f21b1e4-8c1c-4f00-85c7-23e2eab30c09 [Thermothielavioides terrestris]|uniref:Asl1-like glycosyl hydrolase catalytic domain-containing protein n=2 Tax=Thermothielavioides terrestris TaxID=2587410 RepID=G2RFT0_THETT|nr:uncharacterized protein THITE_2124409 [Thermothielavioides terrestris NRRL 8126]AEO71684.1 hypothetical protein THITE_2124409 [Thermothielavioides terrestris NRRL 8126]SPQ27329.1 9f21b1e4-8c1c-4f00-85c7-23e2eab30c09 [Thermothielavioides terrestris]